MVGVSVRGFLVDESGQIGAFNLVFKEMIPVSTPPL